MKHVTIELTEEQASVVWHSLFTVKENYMESKKEKAFYQRIMTKLEKKTSV